MDLANILTLVSEHRYLPLVAVVIGLLVRTTKADVIGPTLPGALRPYLAGGLGLVGAAANMIVLGASLKDALVMGIGAPLLALVGHKLGIEVVRDGKEIPLPGMMKK